MQKEILLPTLKIALEREHITKQEFDILSYLIKKDDMAMKAEELSTFGITDSRKIVSYK